MNSCLFLRYCQSFDEGVLATCVNLTIRRHTICNLQVRRLFNEPEVTPSAEVELKWTDCDEAALLKFLVEDMGFSSDRVVPGIKRLKGVWFGISLLPTTPDDSQRFRTTYGYTSPPLHPLSPFPSYSLLTTRTCEMYLPTDFHRGQKAVVAEAHGLVL